MHRGDRVSAIRFFRSVSAFDFFATGREEGKGVAPIYDDRGRNAVPFTVVEIRGSRVKTSGK